MRFLLWISIISLSFTFSSHDFEAERKKLLKRVKEFNVILESRNLSSKEKKDKIKAYIIPGKEQQKMADFFYYRWEASKVSSSSKVMEMDVQQMVADTMAIVWMKEKINNLQTGTSAIQESRIKWLKHQGVWYRSTEISEKKMDTEEIPINLSE